MAENRIARYQVVETEHGYAVMDTRKDRVSSRTYKYRGNAINAAVKLEDGRQYNDKRATS